MAVQSFCCELPPVQVILNEIQYVVAAMRLNRRWAPDSGSPPVDAPLLSALVKLRETLSSIQGSTCIPSTDFIKPFLDVIVSDKTTGPITTVALAAVQKFLLLLLHPSQDYRLAPLMQDISYAVTHCRFEATDPETDQLTLSKILDVLLTCVVSPAGVLLSEDTVCEIVETCYRMTLPQKPLGTLLRSMAEHVLVQITQSLFAVHCHGPTHPLVIEELAHISSDLSTAYGEKALVRILRFVSALVDPEAPPPGATSQMSGLAETKFLGLGLISVILEVVGNSLPEIEGCLDLLQRELCPRLLQLLHSPHISLLALTLQVLLSLFVCARQHLKLHMEAFFAALARMAADHAAQSENPELSFDRTELILETIVSFCKHPPLTVELYANYDCDIYCTNLFRNLCEFLYRSAFPRGNLSSLNLLALEGLLSFLDSIISFTQEEKGRGEPSQLFLDLQAGKQKKQLLAQGVDKFNQSPKEGLEFLKGYGHLPDPLDPRSVALFLRHAPGLAKQVVGEYLASKHPFNVAVLKEYIYGFGFANKKFLPAFRDFVQSFHLPVDSNLINRIMETFGCEYCRIVHDSPFENADACYILAYSVILLNVDQHNSEVKERMNLQQYIKNNRGINDKKNLPTEFLSDIFEDIRKDPIRIPEEFPSGTISKKACADLLLRISKVVPYCVASDLGDFHKDVFSVLWGPLISALSIVFEASGDEPTIERTLFGFSLCARVAAYYHLTEVFDYLVIYLCKYSSLLEAPSENRVVSFGTNRKAQLATKTVFRITRKHGDQLHQSWRNLINCIVSLHRLQLLPISDLGIRDFEAELNVHRPTVPSLPAPPRSTSHSWLSSLASSWWSSSDSIEDVEPPTVEDREAQEQALQCVKECKTKELFLKSCELEASSLLYLIKALILASNSDAHEESALFCYDVLSEVALQNEHRVLGIWGTVFDHFSSVLLAGSSGKGILSTSPVLSPRVEGAVVCLLVLCIFLGRSTSFGRECVTVLRMLASLAPALLSDLSVLLAQGLSLLLLQGDEMILGLREWSGWGSAFTLLQAGLATGTGNQAGAVKGFETLVNLVLEPTRLTFAEFPSCVQTIMSFATSRVCGNDLAIQAMELLYSLFSRVASASGSLHNEAGAEIADAHLITEWELWQPILLGFGQLCLDSRLEVRNNAMHLLQRALLAPQLGVLSADGWAHCFRQILFPVLRDMLKPIQATPDVVDEIRLRVAVLLSKIFLQHLSCIINYRDFSGLWVEILQFVERYMAADNSELLSEAVPESLKNMLLVMSASGIFEPGAVPSTPSLWKLTWDIVDRICPSLKEDILTKVSLNSGYSTSEEDPTLPGSPQQLPSSPPPQNSLNNNDSTI